MAKFVNAIICLCKKGHGAAIKCKPYSEITVESRTQIKTVKITSNIFAVYIICSNYFSFKNLDQFATLTKKLPKYGGKNRVQNIG